MTTRRAAGEQLSPGGSALFRVQAALLGFLCFSATAIPRLLPSVLGALALVAAIHVWRADPWRPLALLRTPVGIALSLFVAYLFVNACWAADPGTAFAKAAAVLGLAAAAFLVASSFILHPADEACILAKAALAGLLVGVAFLLIELAFEEPIKRFVTNNIVVLFDLSPKKGRVVDGELTDVPAFILNRNVTSLVLLLIPGMLFASALADRAKQRAVLAALLLGAAACVLMSESGTSVMAFFVGAIVLGLAALSLKVMRIVLVAGWTVAVLFAVPLSALPYELGWNRLTFVSPESVAARFYIWKHFADEAAKHPLAGIGIRGTRALNLRLPADLGTLDEPEPKADGRRVPHPHNVFLQIWLELGAIGAVLALGVGLAALWQIWRLPRLLEIGASGLFAVCATVAASGFDLWQTWLLASYAFAWAALQLATGLPTLAPEAAKSPR